MTKPLALVIYERLMPGSQLVNRLQDQNYRVRTLNRLEGLAEAVQQELPLLLVIDLTLPGDAAPAIKAIRSNPATSHIPVICFAPDNALNSLAAAQNAGATVAVSETAMTNHLPEILDQALHLD